MLSKEDRKKAEAIKKHLGVLIHVFEHARVNKTEKLRQQCLKATKRKCDTC